MSGCRVPLFEEKEVNRERLKQLIESELETPVVFKEFIASWEFALTWTPQTICNLLGSRTTEFKICPMRKTDVFSQNFGEKDTIFETQCLHVEASFTNLQEWLQKKNKHSGTSQSSPPAKKSKPTLSSQNPLMSFSSHDYWIYADYKYMCQLCSDLVGAIDWDTFGFEDRNGSESTLWIGSEGACTPCHYDTYGCNLVAQLSGTKKWMLYSPTDTSRLYPTRVPYEESSVFSEVNVTNPDLAKHPLFKDATAYEVVLECGDVLFVPRHWWHYVECIDPAVSVNTWIEVPEDARERVKEGIARTLVSAFGGSVDKSTTDKLINPHEVLFSLEDNLKLLTAACQQQNKAEHDDRDEGKGVLTVGVEQLIKAVTSNNVLELVTHNLLQS